MDLSLSDGRPLLMLVAATETGIETRLRSPLLFDFAETPERPDRPEAVVTIVPVLSLRYAPFVTYDKLLKALPRLPIDGFTSGRNRPLLARQSLQCQRPRKFSGTRRRIILLLVCHLFRFLSKLAGLNSSERVPLTWWRSRLLAGADAIDLRLSTWTFEYTQFETRNDFGSTSPYKISDLGGDGCTSIACSALCCCSDGRCSAA